MTARARIHAMFTLDEDAAKELDARLDALLVEELRAVAADLDDRLRAGGPRARGLVHARNVINARADGAAPPPARRNVVHSDIAAGLRSRPGVWAPVGEYHNSNSAAGIARMIRSGIGPVRAYLPAGAFETRTERTASGTRLLARYVGSEVAR